MPRPIGVPPAADVAEIFDEARVPNVLWGDQAVTLAGEDYWSSDIEFVIPDHFTHAASEALYQAEFPIWAIPTAPNYAMIAVVLSQTFTAI